MPIAATTGSSATPGHAQPVVDASASTTLGALAEALERLREAVSRLQATLGTRAIGGGLPPSPIADCCCGASNPRQLPPTPDPGIPPSPGPGVPAPPPPPSIDAPSDAARATVADAWGQMTSTVVGDRLNRELSRHGGPPRIRVLDDAAFDASVDGAGHAEAYYAEFDGVPTIALRASTVGQATENTADLAGVLAHEAYHALDSANGGTTYIGRADIPASGRQIGERLRREAGAETVASVIKAEMQNAAKVRQKLASPGAAAAALEESYRINWDAVAKAPEYNATGAQLPPEIDPQLRELFLPSAAV